MKNINEIEKYNKEMFRLSIFCMILFFLSGCGVGFYLKSHQISTRVDVVISDKKECYEIQDIEIIVFGEPQL